MILLVFIIHHYIWNPDYTISNLKYLFLMIHILSNKI